MLRFLAVFLGSSLLLLGQHATAEVRFQAQIDHVRFDAVNGIILAVPQNLHLSDQSEIIDESGALISLIDLEARQLEAGQMHWVRAALDADGNARRVEVLGIDPTFPELADDEVTVLIRDINTDNNSILPEPYPFVEITPLSLESPSTSIFDADGRWCTALGLTSSKGPAILFPS